MKRPVDYVGKRAFDVAVSALALVLTSPISLVIASSVKMTSRGPVFHRALRVGRNGRPFVLYKFRSMRPEASMVGPGVTAAGDKRITAIGRILRSTKLDELPQLWNVLRGEMSIVGPRPEDPRYVEWYTPEQRRVLRWKPGITSPASVTYRDEEHLLSDAFDLEAAYRIVMVEKLRIDLSYFEHASLWGDISWIVETARAVVRRHAPVPSGAAATSTHEGPIV